MPSTNENINPSCSATTRLWTRDFALVCVLNFLNFAGMWMLPAMLPVFIRDLGAPDYMLGWVAGLTAIATIITRPLAGCAVNRFGRRSIFSVGTLGMILTCVAFTFSPFLGAVFVIRFIQGLAWGFTNTSCATIASDTIPRQRYAEGMGYFSLASSVAMIITPALSLSLFYTWGGNAAVLVCAGFFVLSLLCSCCITYVKLPPSEKKKQALRRTFAVFAKDELFERSALTIGLLMMLTATSYGILQSYVPTMMEGRGLEGTSLFFIVMAVAAFAARPLFGRWADRRNYCEPAVVAFISTALGMMILVWTHESLSLFMAASVLGIGYSAGFSLFLALASVGVKPERRGSAIATVMVGFDIGAGASAVILGLLSATLGYEFVFIGGGILAVLGIVLTLRFRQRLTGR